jgi:hypothetical protein
MSFFAASATVEPRVQHLFCESIIIVVIGVNG